MPRYFFHTEDGKSVTDGDGVELPDIQTAKAEAIKTLGEILQDSGEEIWADHCFKLQVTDAGGMPLFLLEVSATELPAPTASLPDQRARVPG